MAIWHNPTISLAALNDLGRSNMAGHLGIEFTAAGDDWLKARMPVDERTMQPWGRLHGGASVALAETVGSVAAMLTLDPSASAVGLDINANHVRPTSSGFVHAVARCESIGRTTQVWSIRITDDDERLVSIARLTIAVIPARTAEPTGEPQRGREMPTPPERQASPVLQVLLEGLG